MTCRHAVNAYHWWPRFLYICPQPFSALCRSSLAGFSPSFAQHCCLPLSLLCCCTRQTSRQPRCKRIHFISCHSCCLYTFSEWNGLVNVLWLQRLNIAWTDTRSSLFSDSSFCAVLEVISTGKIIRWTSYGSYFLMLSVYFVQEWFAPDHAFTFCDIRPWQYGHLLPYWGCSIGNEGNLDDCVQLHRCYTFAIQWVSCKRTSIDYVMLAEFLTGMEKLIRIKISHHS